MGLLLSTCISTARGVLNDTRPSTYRYSDTDLLAYGNEAIKELVSLAPEYFHQDGVLDCTPGTVLQALPWSGAVSLVSVLGVVGGSAVSPVQRRDLDLFRPGWGNDAAAPASHFMRNDTDPVRFMVYPKAPDGQQLAVVYVRAPDQFGAAADTGLPETLAPAIADYIIGRAESRDDEHANSNRAITHMAAFRSRFMKGAPNGVQGG